MAHEKGPKTVQFLCLRNLNEFSGTVSRHNRTGGSWNRE